jgi:uncharacterized membrane protein
MKIKNILILIFTLILSFHMVSALEIESYKITTTPTDDNTAFNIIELTVYNDKETSLTEGSLNVAKDAQIHEIRDSYGVLKYTTKIKEEKQKLSFTFTTPINAQESRVITIETTTTNIVQRQGYFEYLLVLVPTKEITSFTHILKLKNDASLYSMSEKQSLVIPSASITETEEEIFIEWKTPLAANDPTIFLARFDQDIGTNWWRVFGIIILALLVGILIGISVHKIHIQHKKRKALNAAKILNIREQAVIEYIIKNGSTKQSELVRKLDYTKSNMSKILKRLELRELIMVKKEGKVRIISVGDKIGKNL